MPKIADHSPDNPEFARVVDVAALRESEAFDFDIAASEDEARRVAGLLGAQEVRKLRLGGTLSAIGARGWRLEARLRAAAVQTCVVSLEPVTTRIDQEIERKFLPMEPPRASEVEMRAEDDETIEPLGERIDLGLIAIEALALALPTYPRKEGAQLAQSTFAGAGVTPLTDEDVKPFSALAGLKEKLGRGG